VDRIRGEDAGSVDPKEEEYHQEGRPPKKISHNPPNAYHQPRHSSRSTKVLFL
jgi:hypothetical protein